MTNYDNQEKASFVSESKGYLQYLYHDAATSIMPAQALLGKAADAGEKWNFFFYLGENWFHKLRLYTQNEDTFQFYVLTIASGNNVQIRLPAFTRDVNEW